MSTHMFVSQLTFFSLFCLKIKSQNIQFSMIFLGNDEVVKALIFDGVVTNDFENQKSPRGRGGMA